MIDVNTAIGHWPFRPLPGSVETLSQQMQLSGIKKALVSNINSIFYKDPMDGNEELFKWLVRPELFLACVINPTFSGWKQDLLTCVHDFRAKAVKLYPGYHHYSVESAATFSLFETCIELEVPVIIVLRLEDERIGHDLAIVHSLPLDQIARTAQAFPHARIVVSGCNGEEVKVLCQQKDCSNLYFEISNVNAPLDPIRELSQHIAPKRLLLGTNYPHQYMLPSIRKLDNSILENTIKQNIACDNAQRLFKI